MIRSSQTSRTNQSNSTSSPTARSLSMSNSTNGEHETILIARQLSHLTVEEKEKRQQTFDRLEFLQTVGTGSYGRVVLTRDRETSKYYALKILSITRVVQHGQTDQVKREKEILSTIEHPFIVRLHWTYHSEQFLFMSLDYVPGGELFTYMRQRVTFDLKTSLFYITEIVLAFEYLHSLKIIYRDLKPENILLDAEGHTKLIDFGFAKRILNNTFTPCGTPDYLSPEILRSTGHNKSTDWWTLGVLFFEMLTGGTPFNPNLNEVETHNRILSGRISWPRFIDEQAKSFIKKLLVQNPEKRLGNGLNGSQDVKDQAIFASIKWSDVYHRRMTPPIIPKVEHSGDASCFERSPEDWRLVPLASNREVELFLDF